MSRPGFNAIFPQAVCGQQPQQQRPVFLEFSPIRPERSSMAFGHPVVQSMFMQPMAAPTFFLERQQQLNFLPSFPSAGQVPAASYSAAPAAAATMFPQQYTLQHPPLPFVTTAMFQNQQVVAAAVGQRQGELPKRENKAIPIRDPITNKEIVLTPPVRPARTQQSQPPILFTTDKPLMPPATMKEQAPPNKEGPLISSTDAGFEPPRAPNTNATVKPSVRTFFRDGQPVASSNVTVEAEKNVRPESERNDLLFGVIDRVRAKTSERAPSATISTEATVRSEVKTTAPAVSERPPSFKAEPVVAHTQPAEPPEDLNKVIGPKFIGLLAPANDFSLAYEKREIKQEESQWLPVGMQASDDEDEFIEDFVEEDQLSIHEQVVVGSSETEVTKAPAASEVSTKRLSREFLMSCYTNPATKIKPQNMSDSSVVLTKPIENLLDVLKKALAAPAETQERSGRNWYGLSRSEMGRPYGGRQQDIQLHKAQEPYHIKTSSDLTDVELKTRQFRGLMNKITESNRKRIIERMAELELNKEELYKPILEVIFDKAIQEPNYCSVYAQVCEFLTKTLRLSKIKEDGGTEKVTFKQILVGKVQESFQKRLSDVEAFVKLEKELAVTTSDVTKKKLREEMDEVVRDAKRKYMGNMKFIGQLFKLDVFNQKLIEFCVEILFDKNIVEWQYESLCNLMFVIGSMLDVSNPKFVDNIITKMKRIMPSISDNRIRFMFMDVFEMRSNGWKSRKQGNKEPVPASNHGGIRASRPQLSSRHSGMSSQSSQHRYQYMGSATGSQRNDSPANERKTLSFDKPEMFDRFEHSRPSSRAGSRQRTREQQPKGASKKPQPQKAPLRAQETETSKTESKESKMQKLQDLQETKGFYKFEDVEKTLGEINKIIDKDQDVWKRFLPTMYEAAMGYDEDSCVRFGRLIFTALRSGALREADLLESVRTMWANAEDIKLDVPFFYSLMGATLTDVLNHKYPDSAKLLHRLYDPIAKQPGAGKAIGRMLELACKQFSNENVKAQIDLCGFDLKKYCSQEELHTLLETKVIAMLLTSEMFLRDIYDILVSMLPDDTPNEEIIAKIEKRYKNGEYKTPKVMQPVMHALLDVCVEFGPNNEIKGLRNDVMESRSPMLLSFVKDEDYEAEAINVICNYVKLKEIPFGLLEELFTVLRDYDFVSDESFLRWRQQMKVSESSNSSSGTLVLATKKFFEWLDRTKSNGADCDDD